MIGWLPSSLNVGGEEQEIRTDFRDVLTIMDAFGDPDLANDEKYYVLLTILYKDLDFISQEKYPEAIEKALWFLDCGQIGEESKPPYRVMDWAQDESIIFPAINKVAGKEVRAAEGVHWWTFMGYYMEIGDGTLSTVLGIRQKKAKGKSLEKWESEFYRNNRQLCDLKKKYTAAELGEIEYWNKLLN